MNQLYHFRREGINSVGNFYGNDAILYVENIPLSQQLWELSFVIIPLYKWGIQSLGKLKGESRMDLVSSPPPFLLSHHNPACMSVRSAHKKKKKCSQRAWLLKPVAAAAPESLLEKQESQNMPQTHWDLLTRSLDDSHAHPFGSEKHWPACRYTMPDIPEFTWWFENTPRQGTYLQILKALYKRVWAAWETVKLENWKSHSLSLEACCWWGPYMWTSLRGIDNGSWSMLLDEIFKVL